MIKEVAFGPLQLMPDQLWKLTMTEFNDLIKGYEWRLEREQIQTAKVLYYQMIAHKLRRPIKYKDILQNFTGKTKKETTKEENLEMFNELVDKLGV